MSAEYTLSEEVEAIAKQMIEMYHPHLRTAQITYVFVDKAMRKSDGRTILGKAAGRNSLDKLLSPKREDFVMIIAKDKWDRMAEEQRRALVDHELCHMGIKVNAQGKSRFALRGHPIEEFPENLGRFPFREQLIATLVANPPSAVQSGLVIEETRSIQVPEVNEEE